MDATMVFMRDQEISDLFDATAALLRTSTDDGDGGRSAIDLVARGCGGRLVPDASGDQ